MLAPTYEGNVASMRQRTSRRVQVFCNALMSIFFNLLVFGCALLALYLAIQLLRLLFPERTWVIDLMETISNISVIIGYIIYTLRDLCCAREES